MVVRTILKLWLLVREGNKGDNSKPVSAVDYLDAGKYPDWICGYLTVNFLVNKIGYPYITSYVNLTAATLMHKRHHMQLFQTSMHSTSQQEGSKLMTVGPHLLLKHSSKSKHS